MSDGGTAETLQSLTFWMQLWCQARATLWTMYDVDMPWRWRKTTYRYRWLRKYAVASLRLMSPGAVTDGVTLTFSFKKTGDLFSFKSSSSEADDKWSSLQYLYMIQPQFLLLSWGVAPGWCHLERPAPRPSPSDTTEDMYQLSNFLAVIYHVYMAVSTRPRCHCTIATTVVSTTNQSAQDTDTNGY